MQCGQWRRGRARTVVAVCFALGLTVTGPAVAEPTDPSPTSASEPTPSQSPSTTNPWEAPQDSQVGDELDTPLSSESLEDQIAQADKLTAGLAQDSAEISRAVKELRSYSTKANTLLQAKAKARDEYLDAKREADDAQSTLDRSKKRLSKSRQGMREWATDTYTQGSGYTDAMTLIGSLTQHSASGTNSAGDLDYLTDQRLREVSALRESTETKESLTAKKERSEAKARKAKKRADKAKAEVDTVLKQRKSDLEALRQKHAEELKKAGPVVNALLGTADSQAEGASDRLKDALGELGQDVSEFEGAKPCSTNIGVYPNGQIPPSALCALIGAPGESLRPDAAAAFNSMSKAYQRDTGQTLCVTDSYRSFAEQVATKANRGGFAATPGKSNHGLGKALDLCGGVNSFGHPAHLWMQQNAALYGWFHPSWAGAGGSLPEPWHWEFAG